MVDSHATSGWDPDKSPRTRSQADDRNDSADDRDRSAEDRDAISAEYDRAANTRDVRADDRDRRAEAREHTHGGLDTGAVSDRAAGWRDRRGAAGDRRHAADDRVAAATDRDLSARERAISSIDELTGAHRRDAGMVELERETARANRTQESFVLAFIDVDGLKATNDSQGHAVGDLLLRRVVATLQAHFRSYDLIVRYGGDEFVCALLDVTTEQAAERFMLVGADLAVDPAASISVGLAELRAHESLEQLITRADTALRDQRKQRTSAGN